MKENGNNYQIGNFYLSYEEYYKRYTIRCKVYDVTPGKVHEYSLGYIQLYEGEYVFIGHPNTKYDYEEINIIKQFIEMIKERKWK